jgi:hypothetical protein
MTRKTFSGVRLTLILSGYACFALSLFMPALHTKIWEQTKTIYGLESMILGAIEVVVAILSRQFRMVALCLLPNVVMGVSCILALSRKARKVLSGVLFAEAGVIFLAALFPDLFYLEGTIFLNGYFVWLISFILTGAGMALEDQKVVKESAYAV